MFRQSYKNNFMPKYKAISIEHLKVNNILNGNIMDRKLYRDC